jgi:hypothetical protein
MSSPDRADTVAVITEAITRAVEYWGGPHDEEVVILAELRVADIIITNGQFKELVESTIAMQWADSHADLSRYGWPDNCNWFTRHEFIRQQREQWYDPTMRAVISATRAPRQFDELMTTDDLVAA